MALQERYSKIVEAKLRSTSLFADIVGRQYEGDPKAGSVKVPVRSECTVAAYDPATGLSGTNTATTFTTINIDQDFAVNEICDGWEAAALPDGKIAERLDSAGYALGKKADDIILAVLNHKTGSTFDKKTACTTNKTKAVDQILGMVAEAKAAGVDANKIFAVVKPDKYAQLIGETVFVQCTSIDEIQNGMIGRLAGIPVYECNNANFTDSYLVGNSDFMHFVADFLVPPTVRDGVGNYIGSAQVVARLVCGAEITKPATVLYK